jgi:hypothetical protein
MKPVRKPRQSKKETYDEAAEPQHRVLNLMRMEM